MLARLRLEPVAAARARPQSTGSQLASTARDAVRGRHAPGRHPDRLADDAAPVVALRSEAKIQPRAVSGWFATWRWALVWATQLLFYGLPWLTWNGRQAVLFDLAARRFYIFGLVLLPAGLHLPRRRC